MFEFPPLYIYIYLCMYHICMYHIRVRRNSLNGRVSRLVRLYFRVEFPKFTLTCITLLRTRKPLETIYPYAKNIMHYNTLSKYY